MTINISIQFLSVSDFCQLALVVINLITLMRLIRNDQNSKK